MTPYDGAMIGVIVAGMVWGAFKGVTWQIASILSLVLGYTAAHTLSGQVVQYFPGEPVVARALAMISVYLATAAGVFFAAWLVRATLKRLQFEAFDRHLGMLLGGCEGALLGLVATLFVVSLAPQTREPIFSSTAGKAVGTVMAVLGPVLPSEARGVLAPFLTGEPATAGPTAAVVVEDARPPAPTDVQANQASLSDMVEESERRIGRAVIDGASDSLRRASSGGNPNVRK